jgi:hypothetical protein
MSHGPHESLPQRNTPISATPLPGEGNTRLTAQAVFGGLVNHGGRFCRENRGFCPRRLTRPTKPRQPCESRVADWTCDAKQVLKAEFWRQPKSIRIDKLSFLTVFSQARNFP